VANSHALLIAVGVIGATVMPHVVFLHSSLTKDKAQGKSLEERKKIRKLHLVETIILLSIAGMINAAIMIMALMHFIQKIHKFSPYQKLTKHWFHYLELLLE